MILFRIDYCNVVFAGLPSVTLAPLRRVTNAAMQRETTLLIVLYCIVLGTCTPAAPNYRTLYGMQFCFTSCPGSKTTFVMLIKKMFNWPAEKVMFFSTMNVSFSTSFVAWQMNVTKPWSTMFSSTISFPFSPTVIFPATSSLLGIWNKKVKRAVFRPRNDQNCRWCRSMVAVV